MQHPSNNTLPRHIRRLLWLVIIIGIISVVALIIAAFAWPEVTGAAVTSAGLVAVAVIGAIATLGANR